MVSIVAESTWIVWTLAGIYCAPHRALVKHSYARVMVGRNRPAHPHHSWFVTPPPLLVHPAELFLAAQGHLWIAAPHSANRVSKRPQLLGDCLGERLTVAVATQRGRKPFQVSFYPIEAFGNRLKCMELPIDAISAGWLPTFGRS